MTRSFSALSSRDRAEAILDRGTFVPVISVSPEMPFVLGYGYIGGVRVGLALSDGHVRGGTIGVREASAIAGLARGLTGGAGRRRRGLPPVPLIIGFDTGGVRVQEGPRALAAASALGVALARMTLLGVRLAAVISGPRGCFGAPSVMAALPERVIMTAGAHWGLTGPRLLRQVAGEGAHDAFEATSAAVRLANGDAHAVVSDDPTGVREALLDFVSTAVAEAEVPALEERIATSAQIAARLERRFHRAASRSQWHTAGPQRRRRRELLRYSFRGQWEPSGPPRHHGLLQAAHGTLTGFPATALIVGPEESRGGGVGIEEVALATEMIHQSVARAGVRRGAIVNVLLCQGHAIDPTQERFGLPRVLAECLRASVAARLCGHPLLSVLGGGTYGAVYLALAAPSHRILALRGTSVAPMAPRVLRAFQGLKGATDEADAARQLAALIPEVHTVASVIRLPRVLQAELTELMSSVQTE